MNANTPLKCVSVSKESMGGLVGGVAGGAQKWVPQPICKAKTKSSSAMPPILKCY
jgi:hypothetical protein